MITLEQVKLLEEKVESLISVVKSLYIERDSLKGTLTQKEKRLEELESTLHSFEIAQAKIEESVMSTLNQLDVFESSVTHDCPPANTSQGIQSEEFSLSDTSESTQANANRQDVTPEGIQSDNFTENEVKKTDDYDKQMDIF